VRIPVLGKGRSWKTPGWKQVNKRVIKDLGRILGWREEYPGKLLSGLGKEISGKTPGFIREKCSRFQRVW
jgi:hypothetical protein